MKKPFKKTNKVVSMAETLKTEPTDIRELMSADLQELPAVESNQLFVNPTYGGLPNTVTHFPDALNFSEKFSLYVGVYLVLAPTGAGKSVVGASLARWANDSGVPAAYLSVFEPRSPTWPRINIKSTNAGAIKDFSQLISNESFSNPSQFWLDAKAILTGRTAKSTPGLLVFDSATDALKANAGERFRGQPTYEGGMQPSDRDFLITGSIMAKTYNVALLLVLNTTLIPYADRLHGACEGLITVRSVQTFSRTDRSPESARESHEIEIPDRYVQESLNAFGFGTLRKNRLNSITPFVGV